MTFVPLDKGERWLSYNDSDVQVCAPPPLNRTHSRLLFYEAVECAGVLPAPRGGPEDRLPAGTLEACRSEVSTTPRQAAGRTPLRTPSWTSPAAALARRTSALETDSGRRRRVRGEGRGGRRKTGSDPQTARARPQCDTLNKRTTYSEGKLRKGASCLEISFSRRDRARRLRGAGRGKQTGPGPRPTWLRAPQTRALPKATPSWSCARK